MVLHNGRPRVGERVGKQAEKPAEKPAEAAADPRDEKRWLRRKEARPSELTAAALSLFVERGFAATRLEDVARRAGVSKGTLYLYFTGKEELFKAVIGRGASCPHR